MIRSVGVGLIAGLSVMTILCSIWVGVDFILKKTQITSGNTDGQTPGPVIDKWLFAGKVVNSETGEWLNNRLVVVYLKGEEVGRALTSIGDNPLKPEGVTDGHFEIEVDNPYQVPTNHLDLSGFENVRRQLENRQAATFLSSYQIVNMWLADVQEGSLTVMPVPSKNITYHLKVFTGDTAGLPPELLVPRSTSLTPDGDVVLSIDTVNAENSGSRVLIQGVRYGVNQETVELNKITVPINNCGGSSPVSQEYSYSQTFYHEYEAGVGGGAGVEIPVGWAQILVELEANYGFKQGQVDTQQVSYNMEAAPGTNVMYVVTSKEEWESGTALVETNQESLEVPFRVRTNVVYEIESEEFSCD